MWRHVWQPLALFCRSAEQNGEDIPVRNRLPRFTAPNMVKKLRKDADVLTDTVMLYINFTVSLTGDDKRSLSEIQN